MKILLAVDDSKFSEAAVQAVISQCKAQGAEICVLHVVDTPSLLVTREMGGYDPGIEAAWEVQRGLGKELLAKTADIFSASGLKCTTDMQEGDPKSKIIEAADKWGADLIIVGSHGRKGLERFLLGSVAEAVARHAHCSVQVVRLRPA
jgi:nucleotide-binding universal stress UspA family protein